MKADNFLLLEAMFDPTLRHRLPALATALEKRDVRTIGSILNEHAGDTNELLKTMGKEPLKSLDIKSLLKFLLLNQRILKARIKSMKIVEESANEIPA